MGFEYLTNVPLTKAKLEYLQLLKSNGFCAQAETVAVFEACGRVTAKAVYANICAPHYAASADAGMGIYSAAQLYGLDFIPICNEEYDLLIPDHAWDTIQVQQMIATLKSPAFREKLLSMGGYTVEGAGELIPLD